MKKRAAEVQDARIASARLITHKVGDLCEGMFQLRAQQLVGHDFIQRAVHTPKPLIARGFIDGKGQMARAQPRMAEPFDVERRPAHPARQKPEEFVARAGEVFRMQLADASGIGLRVHQVVKAVNQSAYHRLAADHFVDCLLHGRDAQPPLRIVDCGVRPGVLV